jgi:hypothetical protein
MMAAAPVLLRQGFVEEVPDLAGMGWQEVVILLSLVVLWIAPMVLIWKTSTRDRGRPALGWVFFAFIVFWFAWIVAGIFFLVGRRNIGQPVGQKRM